MKSRIKRIIIFTVYLFVPGYGVWKSSTRISESINNHGLKILKIVKQNNININNKIDSLRDEIKNNNLAIIKSSNKNIQKNASGEYFSKNYQRATFSYDLDIYAFFKLMKGKIEDTDVVLDVGCGVRPQQFIKPSVHICIEPFEQYRQIIKPYLVNDRTYIFLRGDALESFEVMDDKSVDTIIMLDLIEHLGKSQGFELIKHAERVARKQIIIFTPLGFYPMHFDIMGEKDAWGLDGNELQRHKSGWEPEDFKGSWEFHICNNCHDAFLPEEKELGKKYSAFMAIKNIKFEDSKPHPRTPDFVKNKYVNDIKELL